MSPGREHKHFDDLVVNLIDKPIIWARWLSILQGPLALLENILKRTCLQRIKPSIHFIWIRKTSSLAICYVLFGFVNHAEEFFLSEKCRVCLFLGNQFTQILSNAFQHALVFSKDTLERGYHPHLSYCTLTPAPSSHVASVCSYWRSR